MANYLQSVQPFRWLAILAMSMAVLTLVAIETLLAATPFFAPGFDPNKDKPALLGMFALFGLFLFVCSFILIRLLRNSPASNGMTVLPFWFIRLFGASFLAAGVYASLRRNELLLGVEMMISGMAMTTIGWFWARPKPLLVVESDAEYHAPVPSAPRQRGDSIE